MNELEQELLADKFISDGLWKKVDEHIGGAEVELDRGANNQADEHIRRALDTLTPLLSGEVYTPKERLTHEENLRYKELLRRSRTIAPNGCILLRSLPPEEYNEFLNLQRKAYGD